MSDVAVPPPPDSPDPSGLGPELRQSFVERYGIAQRAVGVAAPLLTTILAFLVGGLVVLVTTGKNPLTTYRAIFEGAGWSWFFEIGNHRIGLPFSDAKVWFPWNVNDVESLAAVNLQQTLIVTTTLIFTGLAVAFAFRCGMFNIGGTGQYLSGAILAVWIGTSFEGMNPFVHIVLAMVVATLAGAAIAGLAGFLKATVGAHEVITTIMLNWTVIWTGSFLFGVGGPLQNDTQASVPFSNDILEEAKLPILWGDPLLQGLHIGLFIAICSARRVLGDPQPDDTRLRRQGSRVQPRGSPIRRNQRRAELLPRDGDLRVVRGARRRDRHPRLAVSALDRRHPEHPARLHRDRGRAARSQYRARRVLLGAPVRFARDRAPRPATSTPRSSSPSSRRTSHS